MKVGKEISMEANTIYRQNQRKRGTLGKSIKMCNLIVFQLVDSVKEKNYMEDVQAIHQPWPTRNRAHSGLPTCSFRSLTRLIGIIGKNSVLCDTFLFTRTQFKRYVIVIYFITCR